MKNIKYLVVLLCMTFVSVSSFAQYCGIQTENDGFQWERICQGDKEGAKSVGGVTFIPLSRGYTRICYLDMEGGWFSVRKGDKKEGVCDITGREIIAPGRYDKAYYHNEDGFEYCRVELNGKEGICDMNGREILAPRYVVFVMTEEGYHYIIVRTNNKKYGLYDINGREIIAPQYDDVFCKDGVFIYKDASGKWNPTGIKVSSLAQTTTSTTTTQTTKQETVTPTPQPQPQPQPQPVRQPQPFQVFQPCGMCQGSGKCHVCLGDGHPLMDPTGRCFACNGTGRCAHCAGRGGQNVIEYH